MENKVSFTLIDGTFEPSEASSLISTLFGKKIEYHNRKILKAHEGSGSNCPTDDARVIELGISRMAFQQKMKEALVGGFQVQIQSTIAVSFIANEAEVLK